MCNCSSTRDFASLRTASKGDASLTTTKERCANRERCSLLLESAEVNQGDPQKAGSFKLACLTSIKVATADQKSEPRHIFCNFFYTISTLVLQDISQAILTVDFV